MSNVEMMRQIGTGIALAMQKSELTNQESLQVKNLHKEWKPGEAHAGTQDDPIPYSTGMQLYNGKYYTEDGSLYLCNRDTGQAVYNKLAELVGLYVEAVEG